MKRTPEEIMELMDKFLDQYDEANDRFDRDQWSKKFGERFGGYGDKLKAVYGDDFDILKTTYDERKEFYPELDEDEYMDAKEGDIKAFIQRIWPEVPEEKAEEVAEKVEEAVSESEPEKEEVHIEAEDKDKDGEISEDEVETHALEEKPEDEEGTTSDARQKRINKMQKAWTGSPHTSGGREGHTSDEECKDEPKAEEPRKKAYDPLDNLIG